MGASPNPESFASGSVGADNLVALHSERWAQIHHLDDLDRRSIVLVVTAITGAVLAQSTAGTIFSGAAMLVGTLTAIVCAGAVYSTVRNRVSMELALATIDFIEGNLEDHKHGLFPYAGSYRPPASVRKFSGRVFFSIRGPIILFFSVALAYVLGAALLWAARHASINGTGSVYLSGALSVVATISFVIWCLVDNWKRGRGMFATIGRQGPDSSS